ncbi:DUF1552 domain-containing protein [Fimbriiglobus ruber]|uniref:Tat (Twin-arginine translocation) pathway signal sequence domain protein n=1 Tax=Fimbriiglobus ruber TaxID=1908690 RepID=A0A225EFV3_9BACT|nr:DUF1552 domain-containing protein [Fimbriiglobus ruber]OWK47225.1 hypothetical protein FRUB_00924 [Fimbriiglobus ruber]
MKPHVSRRTALKGLGTVVALPWLESLASAAAPVAAPVGTGTQAAGSAVIRRAAFLYMPNGVNMQYWVPKEEGKLGTLPEILQPLEPFKDHLNVLTNLALDKAKPNGDGPGDHARAMSAFLTGRQPRKTYGADIRVGTSADQHIAAAVGDHTRFSSLELGIERGQQAGNCDSGYSCAYSSNLSWRSESTPNAKEVDPKLVFDRLFGGYDSKEQSEARAKRDLYNKSILDFVSEDTKALGSRLGQGDQRKLDEYLTAVREIEQRIEKMRRAAVDRKPIPKPNVPEPAGIPSKDVAEHIRLMCDMMVLAFQTDLTRVVTLPFANDGSNRPYPFIGVPEGHHDLSHHGRDSKKLEKIKKINTFYATQLAYLLGKMKAVKEANGSTLLDNVMLVYGSGIGDGDRHNHDDLPILFMGKGGGSVEAGRHLKYPKDTPLMNLYLSIFDRMGAPVERFGDSTGRLKI